MSESSLSTTFHEPFARIAFQSRLHCLFCVALIVFSGPVQANSQTSDDSKDRVWNIRSADGDKTTLTVNCDYLRVLSTDVPVTRVTGITYDRILHNRAGLLMQSACSTGPTCFMFVLAPFGAGAATLLALAPSHRKDHFITLDFASENGQQELTFRAEKGNYKAILEELTKVTGKGWRNLYAERQAFGKWLEQAPRNAELVRLDRQVTIGGVEFKPGAYLFAVHQERQGLGQVFFFSRESRENHPLAWDMVQIREPHQQVSSNEVVYATGEVRVAEVQTPLASLELLPRRVPGDDATTLIRFYGGIGHWIVVRRAQFQGDTAAVVDLRHLHQGRGAESCAGKLYVTRTQIIFNGDAHQFSVPREPVLALAVKDGKLELLLNVGAKPVRYRFKPVYEQEQIETEFAPPELPKLYKASDAEKALAHLLGELIRNFNVPEAQR